MSAQRVTSPVDAKPCRAKASPSVLLRSSESGRARDLAGLFMAGGSAIDRIMTLAAGKGGKKKQEAARRKSERADFASEVSGNGAALSSPPPLRGRSPHEVRRKGDTRNDSAEHS